MPILRKEAEEDIRSAYEWHEKQRENLGRAFILEIDRTFEAMEEQPEAYAQCFKSIRRGSVRDSRTRSTSPVRTRTLSFLPCYISVAIR